jgi:hypothetical protein
MGALHPYQHRGLPMIRLLCAATLALFAAAQAHAADPGETTHCIASGGAVVIRAPEYNTNGGTPFILSGPKPWCEYTSKKDGSTISLLLPTLNTHQPTLAALAYYAQVPPGQCNGNPASCYCSLLGGTDLFGGINAAGGGWVKNNDTIQVLEACIFPDLSSIDSLGLFYHSAGIIRGKDLSKVLHYKNPN